ncbi:MAG: hypothetical protein ACXW50_25720 [Candidatus Binatia bacterium]
MCLDETFKQLIAESREPLLAHRGVERYDHVYICKDVVSRFTASEPLAGWRYVVLTESRRHID